MTGPAGGTSSPIEAYLDELSVRLPRHGGRLRRVLAEAEDHLRDSAAAAAAEGLDPVEAEREAVRRFGAVDVVTAGFRPRLSLWRVGADLLRIGWTLAAVALVAVGVSGAVAALMNRLAGPTFLGGTESPLARSAANCSHLLHVQPAAATCARAAVLETADDAVVLRLLAGVVGLLLLGILRLVQRRMPQSVLPPSFAPTVAVCLFSGAAAVLFAAATHLLPIGGQPVGAGFYLSGAVVAGVVAVGCAALLLQRLVRPPVEVAGG